MFGRPDCKKEGGGVDERGVQTFRREGATSADTERDCAEAGNEDKIRKTGERPGPFHALSDTVFFKSTERKKRRTERGDN